MTLIVFGVAVAESLTFTPLTPDASIDPNVPPQSMVIDLVIVTVPKPPGSRQLISPPAAVFEMAPANVLHGAVRLQGLASSPTPDTQVRVACACASELHNRQMANTDTILSANLSLVIVSSFDLSMF